MRKLFTVLAVAVVLLIAIMLGAFLSIRPTAAPLAAVNPGSNQEGGIIMQERKGVVTMKGNPVTLVGPELKVGDKAPDFTSAANDLSSADLKSLCAGKVCVLSAVPSLDTPVCDRETRRFNEEAGKFGADVKVVTISMDLPFAQKRWCAAAGIENVQTVSDYKDASFGTAYGVLIKEFRLLSRTVFVLDKKGMIRYIQRVPEVTSEPDYNAVLEAVRKLK